MIRTLPGQHLTEAYWSEIKKELDQIFFDIIFSPIVKIIKDATAQSTHEITNSNESILTGAIRSGKVQYSDGIFSGSFNSVISSALKSLGARYNKTSRVFKIDPALVPGWVLVAAAAYKMSAQGTHEEIQRRLDKTLANLDALVDAHPVNADSAAGKIEGGFKKYATVLEVSPELNQASKKELAKTYSQNMKLWIKKFSRETISDLREDVELNATAGYRFDNLIDKIKGRYRVSENKAKFLARQETGLYMSKFRQLRFQEAGVTRYRWSTSHDSRVRESHRHLDGKVFRYSDPPITDLSTGARNNPGADYNCRCVDLPLLERMAVNA